MSQVINNMPLYCSGGARAIPVHFASAINSKSATPRSIES